MTDLIASHLTWLRAAGRSTSTIRDRRRALLHADRTLPWGLDESDEDEIAAYLANDEWATWTRYTYWGHLAGFYAWAATRRYLTLDPMADMPRPKQGQVIPKPCTDAELALALTAPAQPWRTAVMLAAYAGLRCGEIANARREDIVDFRLRVLGKGGKVRVVPISDHLWPAIAEVKSGHLVTRKGEPITPAQLTRDQRSAFRRLGLPDSFHLHGARHWFATRVLQSGADIRVVQELLGHASLQTTQGYTAVTDERMAAAVRRLSQIRIEPDCGRLDLAAA